LAVLFVFISVFTDAHIDLNNRVYKDPFFATLATSCGIYIIVSIAWFISKSKWLSYVPLRLGEASIYILIFHYFIQAKTSSYLSAVITDETALFILAVCSGIVISFGLSISIPLHIKWIVDRSDILSLAFLPFKSNKSLQRMLNFHR
jgi:fucose 4-O-acetylase-like acetyltransferase